MTETLRRLFVRHRELILYGMIGAVGATLDFMVYLLLSGVGRIEPTIATMLSVSVGIVTSFFLNAYLNFKVRTRLWLRFLSFYSIGLIGVVLSALIVWVFTGPIDVGFVWAKLLSIPLVVVAQFVANKRVTFAQRLSQEVPVTGNKDVSLHE